MKNFAGKILVALSIICFVLTILWVVYELTNMPENPNEDDRTAYNAFLLFVGILIVLEVIMFLFGRYFKHPGSERISEHAKKQLPKRRLPLVIYLAGSIVLAIVVSVCGKLIPQMNILGFFPYVFAQLFFGGLLGIKQDGGIMAQATMFVTNLLYFTPLLYPVYRLITMNRTVELVSYRRMKILLILIVSVHILMVFAVAMLSKA